MPLATSTPATGQGGSHPEPLRVLIADDHALFRRGITRAVEGDPRFSLVAEATDGREALDLIAAVRPDVAVLDHRMPGLTGVEVCGQMRSWADGLVPATLLLSAFEDAEIVADAVRAGTAGYIGKTATPQEICDAIERVGRGGIAYSATTAAGVNEVFRSS
jgi:two-component system nitrate/nitrite response regulator NarL